jgi:hypothetical protein
MCVAPRPRHRPSRSQIWDRRGTRRIGHRVRSAPGRDPSGHTTVSAGGARPVSVTGGWSPPPAKDRFGRSRTSGGRGQGQDRSQSPTRRADMDLPGHKIAAVSAGTPSSGHKGTAAGGRGHTSARSQLSTRPRHANVVVFGHTAEPVSASSALAQRGSTSGFLFHTTQRFFSSSFVASSMPCKWHRISGYSGCFDLSAALAAS